MKARYTAVALVALVAAAMPVGAQNQSERTEAEILFSLDAGGLPRAAWGGILQETRPEIRIAGARLLASRPDPELLFAVRMLARDPVPTVRATAVIAAGRYGAPASSAVIENLADKAPGVRQAAAWAACEIGEGFDEAVLRRILVERDVDVLETLLGQAWRLGDPRWVARVAGFTTHTEPRLRRAAAASLARAPDGLGRAALRRLLTDDHEVIAATAALGFGSGPLGEADRAALLAALGSGRPRLQAAVCQAWSRNRVAETDEATATAIAALFNHEHPHVRAAALEAAITHESMVDADTLAGLAAPGSWSGRLALEALAARGEGGALVRAALASDDLVQARAGARAAARLGGRVLKAALGDPRAGVRLAALEALEPVPDAPWLTPVRSLLEGDADVMVRARAVDLVVRSGAIETADELFDLASAWSDPRMADARAAALAAVFDLTEAADPRDTAVATALEDDVRLVADLVSARARREGLDVWPALRSPRRQRSWYLELTQWRKADHDLVITTGRGSVRVRLDAESAPITSREIWELARDGFYDGLVFHRVVPNFVVQGGDPRGDGWGGAAFVLPDEVTLTPFDSRRVGIATSGANTGSSQFFFMLMPADRLTGHYTNFGEVVEGQEVLEQLELGDRILSVTVDRTATAPTAP
jgi:cyclophilin family peptidyl-prolyl cis-trans isomerase